MPNRLLLAEGDPKSLRVLDVSLRGAGFLVETARTGAEAWANLERALPDVVIAATDLTEVDGFELCGRMRQRADGARLPIILLGTENSVEAKVKGLQAGADEFLVKPVLVNDMVARVLALVRRRDRDKLATDATAAQPFAGKLSDLAPVDLVEVVAAGNRSGIVHLRDLRGSPGTLYFRRGAIVDAEVGRLSGQDAIGRLFSWSQGTFEVEYKSIRRPDAIQTPVTELVVEGMRRLDDWNHLASQLPDLHEVYEVNYRVLAERLAEIPDEVNAVLRLFDGARSLAHVVEDSTLTDLDALGMVIRLRDEGIIRSVALRKSPRRGTDAPRPEAAPEELSSRSSTASRAVDQSYANRLARDAGEPPSAPSEPAALSETAISPPPMTRTAPGLGQPVADAVADGSTSIDVPDAVPQPREPEENVIRVQDEASSPVAAASAPAPEPLPEEEPVPEQVAALHHTQRGMGPMGMARTRSEAAPAESPRPASLPGVAPPTVAQADAADEPVDGTAGLQTLRPEPLANPDAPRTHGATNEGAVAATLVLPPGSDGAPARAVPPPPPKPADADGVVAPNPAVRADETVRVSFPDEELSQREALEELGLPGGRRVLRVLGVLLAMGALSAVVVQRLRTKTAEAPAPAAAEVTTPAMPGAAPEPTGRQPRERQPDEADHAADPVAAPPPVAQNQPGLEKPATPERGLAADRPPASSGERSAPAAVLEQPSQPAKEKDSEPQQRRAAAQPEPGPTEAVAKPAPPTRAEAAAGEVTKEPAKPAQPTPSSERATTTEPTAPPRPEKPAAPAPDFAHQLQDCRSQFLRNKLRDASTSCAAALQTNPRSADALTLMAHVELNRGRPNRANELAQKAVAIDPRQADAYVIIGGVHQDNGRVAQAKAAYNQYLELSPHGRYAAELRSIIGNL
jgi:CheY-like chemotaxis protein